MKHGFTLAEVLITLGIIGVVAAITLPTIITNINERINSERQANIAQKITQAMEQMRAHGLLNTQYASTDAFVDELQKYLKIAKRCDSAHIADCWPTEKVKAGDGKEYKISLIKTGKHLQLQTVTSNVGLVLLDGTPIILNYNPNTNTFDIGDRVTSSIKWLPVGGKSKEFPYTTNITNSIDFIMDVNGAKGPNSETIGNKMHDIRSFSSAKIKGCIGTYISNLGCVVEIENYTPITEASESLYITKCNKGQCNNSWPNVDYWQSAINSCKALGNEYSLPNKENLKNICNQKNKFSTLPQKNWYWSSSIRNDDSAYPVIFDTCVEAYSDTIKYNKYGILCLGNL